MASHYGPAVEAQHDRRADDAHRLGKRFWRELTAKKKVDAVIATSKSKQRWLTRRHLVVASLAAMIGAGISDDTRLSLSDHGGPSTVAGLLVAAIASFAAAVCFAELASTIPVSGSTYTYAYATFNQAFAWMVGWILLIEYAVGAFVIALSWSRSIPGLPGDPLWWAVGLVVICGLLLGLTGGGESHEKKWQILAFLVGSSVAIKVVMLLVTTTAGFVEGRFVLVGHGGDPSGWQLFGAAPAFSVLYFSFIGFDAPSTAAEDARYPQRDLASSILLSLTIVSVLYFVFAMSGGGSSTLPGWVTEWGAALGRPSGVFVLLYGQRQILLAVWRDELLGRWGSPPGNEAADRSWRWESFASVAVSVLVSGLLVKGFNFDDSRLTMFVNVATGTAFAIVALGTGVLRVRRPDLPRTFTAPFLPVAVLLAIASSCVLLVSTRAVLPAFGIWVGVGAVVYLVVLTARLRG